MGSTLGDAETYPRLADVLGFISPHDVIPVGEAVVTAQRDMGNRATRKRARLKYTIDEHGLDAFRAEVERRSGVSLQPPRAFEFVHSGDRFGWVEADNGRWHLTLRIPAGRIQDSADHLHLTGLREVAKVHRGHFRMTPNQNLVIADIAPERRAGIDALLRRYGLLDALETSPLKREALACVALPTCGLAMAEAERYLDEALNKVQALLDRHGIGGQSILLRISGCPNGCSRPYLGEIALVGKAPGRYNLMLGADHRGQRLNRLYRENITEAEILAELDPLIARYAAERGHGEHFGDFLLRVDLLPPEPLRVRKVLAA
jgi:sulfite reductase (NADPH) hemoprotein beta-component